MILGKKGPEIFALEIVFRCRECGIKLGIPHSSLKDAVPEGLMGLAVDCICNLCMKKKEDEKKEEKAEEKKGEGAPS